MSEDVPEDSTPAWSADDPPAQPPQTDVDSPESSTQASEPAPEPETPEGRGTRAERRSARDRTTRDDRVRAERDDLRAERDSLSARVASMQKQEVHRLAAEHLAAPADLDLIVGAEEYSECFTESGEIDEGAVAALVDSVLDAHPHWKRAQPRSGGFDMSHRRTAPADTPTARWQDILRS